MKQLTIILLSPYTREYNFEDHKETNLQVEIITLPYDHVTKEQAKTVFRAANISTFHKSILYPELTLPVIQVKLEYDNYMVESIKQNFKEIARILINISYLKNDEIFLEESFVEKCIERRSTGLFDKIIHSFSKYITYDEYLLRIEE